MEQKLKFEQMIDFIKALIDRDDFIFELYPLKHKIIVLEKSDDRKAKFEIKLPLPFPKLKNDFALSKYVNNIFAPSYLIILIQAGNCALGYVEDEEIIYHKVIKKYMVRKKQGKAQITYLNKKGKSRAGSRIRLNETKEFFEEINEKLSEWNRITKFDKIIYSSPPKLWGMLHASKIKPPFNKKDERLIKIPLDINKPNFEELIKVYNFANYGFVKNFSS